MPPCCFSVFGVKLDHYGKLNNQSSITKNECVVHLEASFESKSFFFVLILIDVLQLLLLIFILILRLPCVDKNLSRLFLFFLLVLMWIFYPVFLLEQFSDNSVFVVDHDIVEQLEEACQLSGFFGFAYLITCLLNQVRYNMDKLEQLPIFFYIGIYNPDLLFFCLCGFQMTECVADQSAYLLLGI